MKGKCKICEKELGVKTICSTCDNIGFYVSRYDDSCDEIRISFIYCYYCDEEEKPEDATYYWVADRVGEVTSIGDDFWNMQDMVTALRLQIPRSIVHAWYSHSMDCAIENKTCANLENYYRMIQEKLTNNK